MTRALLALLLILGQIPAGAATRRRAVQHPSAPVPPAAIVAAARQAAEAALKAGVPAVQIAVSHRERIVYSGAFGLSDRESATAATPRSVLQVASVTKQFSAAAILRLAERGALTLDDRIDKFVPEFNTRGATITLRHLLSHTSGVRREWWKSGGLPPDPYSPLTREQFMTSINAHPLEFTPGSRWSYSNAGYMLLGYAIESVTGRPFAEFVHEEFALQLGLLDTGVCGTSNLPLPDGYSLLQGTMTRTPAVHPSVFTSAAALCSTASDLARWSHLLAIGRVMLPASYATMTTATRRPDNTLAPYGLGVFVQNHLGIRPCRTPADCPGSRALSSISPSRALPLRSSPTRSPRHPASTRLPSPSPWRAPRSPRSLRRNAGSYTVVAASSVRPCPSPRPPLDVLRPRLSTLGNVPIGRGLAAGHRAGDRRQRRPHGAPGPSRGGVRR